MVIYGDILFILNMIIDYLLLGLTSVVVRREVGLLRRLIAAIIGGLSSFYIFIENENFLIDLLFRLSSAIIMILIIFGLKNLGFLIKSLFIYYSFAIFLSGVALLLSNLIKHKIIEINNTYFYIGISPIILIVFSVVSYIILVLFLRIRKSGEGKPQCTVSLYYKDNCFSCIGLIDSGNSIRDLLSDSEIFISNDKAFQKLTGFDIDSFFTINENFDRCRIVPASTISGNTILKAVRIDRAKLNFNNKEFLFMRPIIAVSESFKDKNFDLIIPNNAIEGD